MLVVSRLGYVVVGVVLVVDLVAVGWSRRWSIISERKGQKLWGE